MKQNKNMSLIEDKHRRYRTIMKGCHLKGFRVAVKETDVFIYANHECEIFVRDLILKQRGYIESYIGQYPDFLTTLSPWTKDDRAPEIVRNMIDAGKQAGVGPMASVAGAIAEQIGKSLLSINNEAIVENGGDVFIQMKQPLTVAIYAGNSPFTHRIGIKIMPKDQFDSICTSSGRVGHSLSMGKAHAVTIRAKTCALADAVATATGNLVHQASDIQNAIQFAQNIDGVFGVLIIVNDKIGLWGDMEIVPIQL